MEILKFVDSVYFNGGQLMVQYFGMRGIAIIDSDLIKKGCGYFFKDTNSIMLSTDDFVLLVFKTSDFDEAVKFLANRILERIYNKIDYTFSKLNIKELPK